MPVVYAASDLHGNLPEVPSDAEVLILAGDICPDFLSTRIRSQGRGLVQDKGETRQASWLNSEFRTWLTGIRARNIEVVATWGNHDFVGEKPFLVPSLPWTLLKDETFVWEGYRIYGTPWVPGLAYWAFYGSEPFLRERARAIPEGIDILVSHGPPYGLGDFIPTSRKQQQKYGNYDGEHVGDKELTVNLTRIGAKVLICGHIHEARGWYADEESGTRVANVAAVDESYRLYPAPLTPITL